MSVKYIITLTSWLISSFLFAQDDTQMIKFDQKVKAYDFNLVGKENIFDYDTVYASAFDTRCNIRFKNNTGSDLKMVDVRTSDGSIHIQSWKPFRMETLAQDSSLVISLATTKRHGPIRRTIQIQYLQNGESKSSSLKVKGMILNLRYVFHCPFPDSIHIIKPNSYETPNTLREGIRAYTYGEKVQRHLYQLEENKNSLFLNVQKFFPMGYLFEIKNNSGKKITIDSVVGINDQLAFFVNTDGYWRFIEPSTKEILPDSSFYVRALHYHGATRLNTGITLFYKKRGKQYETQIPIAGIIDSDWKPTKRRTLTENERKAKNQKEEKFNLVVEPKGDLREYEFPLSPKPYPFKNDKPDLIRFKMLNKESFGKVHTLHLVNRSGRQLYLQDYNRVARNVYFKNVGSSIIPADSAALIEFHLDSVMPGKFESSLKVRFLGWNTDYVYELITAYEPIVQGFQPFKNGSRRHNADPDRGKLNILVHKDSCYNSTVELSIWNGEQFEKMKPASQKIDESYKIEPSQYRNGIFFKLEDNQNGVLKKGVIDNYRYLNYFVGIDDTKSEPHTYGRVPFKLKVMRNHYFINWNRDVYNSDQVRKYLESLDLSVGQACQLFIQTDENRNITELQKTLKRSKFKIELNPTIRYSNVTRQGWGGGCEYCVNDFTVSFRKDVEKVRIDATFKQLGITSYTTFEREGDYLDYKFSFDYIADFGFVKTLDRLYEFDEVVYIRQSTSGIAGLD